MRKSFVYLDFLDLATLFYLSVTTATDLDSEKVWLTFECTFSETLGPEIERRERDVSRSPDNATEPFTRRNLFCCFFVSCSDFFSFPRPQTLTDLPDVSHANQLKLVHCSFISMWESSRDSDNWQDNGVFIGVYFFWSREKNKKNEKPTTVISHLEALYVELQRTLLIAEQKKPLRRQRISSLLDLSLRTNSYACFEEASIYAVPNECKQINSSRRFRWAVLSRSFKMLLLASDFAMKQNNFYHFLKLTHSLSGMWPCTIPKSTYSYISWR